MNERIKELAEQAFNEANNGSINNIKIPKEFVEKFAELIVRECVGMLDDEDDYGPYSTGVRSAAYRIKKHFGVKE
jgi:hypothetical protein